MSRGDQAILASWAHRAATFVRSRLKGRWSVQGPSLTPAGRCMWPAVLAVMCLYLPLEAFEGDAHVGFDDACLNSAALILPCPNSVTPTPPSPIGPPVWHRLPSLSLAVSDPLLPAFDEVVDSQVRRLMVSGLSARSRIPGVAPTTTEACDNGAGGRPPHGLTCDEGGCF